MTKALTKLPGQQNAEWKDYEKNHGSKENVKIAINSSFVVLADIIQ